MADGSGDLSLQFGKKKKKKKVVIDHLATEAELKELAGTDIQQPSQSVEPDEPVSSVDGPTTNLSNEGKQEDDVKEELDELSLPTRKKKKKQMPPVGMSMPVEEVPSAASPEILEGAAQERASYDDFVFPKKKKKLRPGITFEGFDVILAVVAEIGADDDPAVNEETESSWKVSEALPWEDSDRDYTYEELLERVFNIIKQNNPNFASGQRRKLVMKPPQVVRVGAKKTSFVNFTEICRLLHRQPKHLMNFLLVELGTSASLDGTQQLIIKGKFQQKQIETVLRRYIKEYVTCHTCRSPETNLHKETRLFFLQCETCGSRCSVLNIKSGFQAVTGKRAQIRSKAQ